MKKTRFVLSSLLALLSGGLFAAIEIPTDGLVFNLDSKERATVQTDANGYVTKWGCCRGSGIVFESVDEDLPFIDETAFGGRGALVFGQDRDNTKRVRTALKYSAPLRNQTVFMVFQWDKTINEEPSIGELYGTCGQDSGIRGDYYNRMHTWSDSLLRSAETWFDGVKQTKRSSSNSNDVIPIETTKVGSAPFVYCMVITNDAEAAGTANYQGTFTPQLAGNSQYSATTYTTGKRRMFAGRMAEVIVYSRRLSDDEIAMIHDLLMHKWYGNELADENVWTEITGSTGSFGSPSPAYGRYAKGELDGMFSIAEGLSTDPVTGERIVTAESSEVQKTVYRGYEVLSADGEVLKSSTTEESFTFTSDEPFTVRWIIERKCLITLTAGENGYVAIGNGDAVATTNVWAWAGENLRIRVVPKEGYHLVNWTGEVSGVDILSPDHEFTVGSTAGLTAVFAEGEPDYPRMLTRGLVFRLDATDSPTVLQNTSGYVTNWYSRVGGVSFDNAVTGIYPYWQADALDGKGAVRFGCTLGNEGTYANTPLRATSFVNPVRTFLVVLNQLRNNGAMFYPLGYSGETMSGSDNYNIVCHLSGAVYNRSFVRGGRVWMDDCDLRLYPGKFAVDSDESTDIFAYFGFTSLNTTHVMIAQDAQSPSVIKERYIALGNANGDPGHSSILARCFPGDMGEVAGYNYTLSPAEVRYMMAYQNKKWRGGTFELPRVSSSMTVSADTMYGNLFIDGAHTITIAEGATVSITNLLVVSDDVTVKIENGATLTIPEIVKYNPGSVVRFELNGGVLCLEEPGKAWRAGYEDNKGDVFISPIGPKGDAAYQSLAWPGPVTGNGTFRLSGARSLKLSAKDEIPDGLTWELFGGSLDLNGRSLTASDMRGPAAIRNTSAKSVTLTVGRDSDFALENRVVGPVEVVRQGTGDMALGGASKDVVSLSLSSGKTTLATGAFNPGSISNLVCHLDASRPDSFEFGDDGRIVCWRSLAGDGARFTEKYGYSQMAYTDRYFTYRGPMYSATAMNGKPGLLFAQDANGNATSVTNSLFSDRSFHSGTVLVVIKPHTTPGGHGVNWGYIWSNSHFDSEANSHWLMAFEKNTSTGKWYWGRDGFCSNTGRICVNGKMRYGEEGLDADAREAEGMLGSPQVYAASFSAPHTFTPAIGSKQTHIRNFRGVISEIVVYSRQLEREEMLRVSTALMAKWGIAPSEGGETIAGDHLAATCQLNLGAEASLDLGGMTHHVGSFTGGGKISNGTLVAESARIESGLTADGFFTPSLTFALTGASYPELKLNGGWDLSLTDLVLEGDYSNLGYTPLMRSASGGFVGSFNSAPEKVKWTESTVSLGSIGMIMYVR